MDLAAPIHSRVVLGSLTTLSAFLLVALGPSVAARSTAPTLSAPAPESAVNKKEARTAYAKLPLAFVPNEGQTDPRVRYTAQMGGASFAFMPQDALFAFTKGRKGHALGLSFLGATENAELKGASPLPGKVNYLLGRDPAKWHTGLPTYREVVYRDLWPGIDLAFRGDGRQLKYEFRLEPGADPADIRLAYRGAERLSLGRTGGLAIRTALGVLRDSRPRSYQKIGERRVPVASRFLLRRGGAYGFAVRDYDRRQPLVIDPGLLYSTYLGGSGVDVGTGIAVDGAGSAYVTGPTNSGNFPTTPGAFDTTSNGLSDTFVAKLNATGSTVLYSTFLGGSNFDNGNAIAIDTAGSAYVTGQTTSANFPTTAGAFDASHNGNLDAFVAKLNPTGSDLDYSTYLGGSLDDFANGIAVDPTGRAHVAGRTNSANFPTTTGSFDTSFNGVLDVFVTKLNPTGSTPLLYSTYVGGSDLEEGLDVALDGAGSAHVSGVTRSTNFPTTPGAFDTSYNGGADAFVTKLNQTGFALLYSTYLGGSGFDRGHGIAVDAAASAHVTGWTSSTNFPTTPGAFDATYNGGSSDAFVTKLSTSGSVPLYSTYLGGSNFEVGNAIAIDTAGSAYVTGQTTSTDFPATPATFDPTLSGDQDAFVTKLDAAGSAPLYSTYLGGSSDDAGVGIAVDSEGSVYLTGQTASEDFPTTPGAFDTSYDGSGDAFVTKLSTEAAVPATLTLSPPAATNPVGTSHTVTATVEDAGGQPVEGVVVRFTVTGSVSASGQCTTDASGQCDFTYQGPPLPGADAISAYADTDEDNVQDAGEPTGAAEKTWTLPPSTEFCEVMITQGGWIVAMNGDRASFGGNARVREDGSVEGHENYQDHGPAQPRHVQSIELTALTCSDDLTSATIFGRATVDGTGEFVFRIDVTDQGEPGTNDSYGITISDGYASGQQPLQGGNVQIHKK